MALVRLRLSPRESGRPRSSTFQPLLPRSPCVLTARYRRGYRVGPRRTIERNPRNCRDTPPFPRNKDGERSNRVRKKRKKRLGSKERKCSHWAFFAFIIRDTLTSGILFTTFRVHFVSLCPILVRKNGNHLLVLSLHVITRTPLNDSAPIESQIQHQQDPHLVSNERYDFPLISPRSF